MAIYNTASDAANTAVRAFLTKVGEYYLNRSFNTGTGKGKADWTRIRDHVFQGQCAYCGRKSDRLQIEHLLMFNKSEYGLHHPGNIVPCCNQCNKRHKDGHGKHVDWKTQLKLVCQSRDEQSEFQKRLTLIEKHIIEDGYPSLSDEENHAIRVIAASLYENIKLESEKALKLYQELDKAFVVGKTVED